MTGHGVTESVVEQAALDWLKASGWRIAHGPDIAPDMPAAERRDYGEVALAQRLRDALARLNPQLPAEALEDAFRKLTRPEGADLIQRNRALHRLLLNRIPPVFFANRTLAALRDALLPRLISGALRVKDAEKFLKERGL